MGANFEYFPNIRELFWVSPLHKHGLLPRTIVELFLSQHKCFSYIWKPSSYVLHVSLIVPYISIFQFLTLVFRHGFSKKLEYCTFVHRVSEMELLELNIENGCYMPTLQGANSFLTFVVYPSHTF